MLSNNYLTKTIWMDLLLCLLAFPVSAQDHLEPAPDYLSTANYQQTYVNKIRSELLANLSDRPLARVVVRSSFAPEYVITVDTLNRVNYLIYRTARESLWSRRDKPVRPDKESVQEYRRPISPALAQALTDLFFDTISQARYPPVAYADLPSGHRGRVFAVRLDGTTYGFSATADSPYVRSGETHSPRPGTLMAELVTVTDRMAGLAKSLPPETEQTLQQAVQTLYRKIVKP